MDRWIFENKKKTFEREKGPLFTAYLENIPDDTQKNRVSGKISFLIHLKKRAGTKVSIAERAHVP